MCGAGERKKGSEEERGERRAPEDLFCHKLKKALLLQQDKTETEVKERLYYKQQSRLQASVDQEVPS